MMELQAWTQTMQLYYEENFSKNKMEIDTGPVCVNTYPKLKNFNWDQEKKLWLRDSYYFLLSSLTFQRQKLRGTSNRGSG